MKGLIWFRVDLRVEDHPALQAARQSGAELIALYTLTPTTWKYHEAAECKIDFIQRNLQVLERRLADLGIPLYVVDMDSYIAVPERLLAFCQQHQVGQIYFNEQYEIDERQRDKQVVALCAAHGIGVQQFHDQLWVQPGMILSALHQPLQKFTPFKKRWLAFADQLGQESVSSSRTRGSSLIQQTPGFEEIGLDPRVREDDTRGREDDTRGREDDTGDLKTAELWPAGEAEAWQRLQHFLAHHAAEYDQWRDFPARAGTSTLSPYLAQGVISIHRVIDALHHAAGTHSFSELIESPGYGTWLNELIWREFYKHILFLFPKVACGQALQAKFKVWPWREDRAQFQLWCEGKTGYPLIDAAMRQLNQTGWMHNRLRMNVAVFLAKFLKIDWRWGESYFSRHLIDGDLSANNGGWQWCAGTGTDAMPYFRMFNPTLQAQKFDPEGIFIRQYCPELRHLDQRAIHLPQPHALEKYQNV